MFKKIKEFFVGKPTPAPVAETAPYKVPEPAATTPIPLVVTNSNPADNVSLVAEAPAPVAVEAPAVVEVAPVVEAVVEAPAKKPRKPRAPKAAPAEKPAEKKAAPKKAAAIKAVPKARSKKV